MLLYEQHKYFFILFEIIHSLIVTIQKPLNCDNSSEFRVKGQTKTHDFCYTERSMCLQDLIGASIWSDHSEIDYNKQYQTKLVCFFMFVRRQTENGIIHFGKNLQIIRILNIKFKHMYIFLKG